MSAQWRLNGTADYVADADVADVIVTSAAADGRTLAFVVDTAATGVTMEPLPWGWASDVHRPFRRCGGDAWRLSSKRTAADGQRGSGLDRSTWSESGRR